LQKEELADWLGLVWLNERDWQVAPTGLDVAHGLPGILLFLSYLGQVTGEARYTTLAQAGLNTLRAVIKTNQAFLDQVSIGAFAGLGSCIYLFSHLAALWQDPLLLQEAEELVKLLPSKIEKDESFDLVDGTAGCLTSLLTLYEVAPSPQILLLAVLCGEHLLAHTQFMPEGLGWKAKQQNVPLAGFAHGTAGIAWSLLRLAAVSKQERFQDAALVALEYERSLFSPEQGNWLDLRKRPASTLEENDKGEPAQEQEQEMSSGMSWNHGAPGIALGRLISLPYLDDATIRAELKIALETTIAHGFGYSHEQVGPNHSLLHGDCGNLESVLLAAQTLQTPHFHEHLERLTAQMLESIQKQGWLMGVPLNVETPGLMLGLAGIGYQCLRLAEPERIPSLLTLAPPRKTASL
jgi:type 2 lantibiotic biosynthesis protein LanM